MIYAATATSKKNPETQFLHIGTYESAQDYAELNAVNFDVEVGPAHADQVQQKLDSLRRHIEGLEERLTYAAWASGPRYRADISGTHRRIHRIQELVLADEEMRAALGLEPRNKEAVA